VHGGQVRHGRAAGRRLARDQALRQRVHRARVAHAQLRAGRLACWSLIAGNNQQTAMQQAPADMLLRLGPSTTS
jgi:hypothetical protein